MRLGQNRARVALMVSAIREGFAALRSLDISVTPFNLQLIFRWMLRWFAVRYWQHTLQTSLGTLGIAPHANAARVEMGLLAREVLDNLHASLVPTPSLHRLLAALTDPAPAPDDPSLVRA